VRSNEKDHHERKDEPMKLTTITNVSVDGVMQGLGAPDEDRRGGFERGGWAPPLFDNEAATFVNHVTAMCHTRFMDDELLLSPRISAKSALDTLRALIREAQNIGRAGGGDFGKIWNGYLNWVETAEFQLPSLFRSPGVWQEIYNDRYWHIRDMRTEAPTRPYPLIQNEAAWQARRLQAIVDQLERVQRDFGELPPDGCAVVPDTSFFMHYHRFFNEIDWPEEIHAGSVRLVVPLLVIDELDDLSFRSKPTSERARRVLRALRELRGDQPPESPVRVRASVDLQVLVDPPRHRRRPNNDDEILARAEYLAAFVGPERVRVAAIDYGMQLRAASRELRWIELRTTPEPSRGNI